MLFPESRNATVTGTIPALSNPFGGPHTICCWFYRTSIVGWAGLFTNNTAGTVGASAFNFNAQGERFLGVNSPNVSGVMAVSLDIGTDHLNQWIFAAISYSGATKGSPVTVYAYKGGTLLSATGALYRDLSQTSQGKYAVGELNPGAEQNFVGRMGYVAVYPVSLSQASFTDLYNSTKSKFL